MTPYVLKEFLFLCAGVAIVSATTQVWVSESVPELKKMVAEHGL